MDIVPKSNLLHQNLLSQGFDMPSLGSQICSKKFMVEIKNGTCFMHGTQYVIKVNVLYPPPKTPSWLYDHKRLIKSEFISRKQMQYEEMGTLQINSLQDPVNIYFYRNGLMI